MFISRVCVYMRRHTNVNVYAHIRIHIRAYHLYMYIYTHTHISMCMHICAYIYRITCVCVSCVCVVCLRVSMCAHTPKSKHMLRMRDPHPPNSLTHSHSLLLAHSLTLRPSYIFFVLCKVARLERQTKYVSRGRNASDAQ